MDVTGMVAFRNGFNYSTKLVTSHNVDFGNTSLVRMTGTGPQTISGIARGVDGAMLTIMKQELVLQPQLYKTKMVHHLQLTELLQV
jgi:hypothetical protein